MSTHLHATVDHASKQLTMPLKTIGIILSTWKQYNLPDYKEGKSIDRAERQGLVLNTQCFSLQIFLKQASSSLRYKRQLTISWKENQVLQFNEFNSFYNWVTSVKIYANLWAFNELGSNECLINHFVKNNGSVFFPLSPHHVITQPYKCPAEDWFKYAQ